MSETKNIILLIALILLVGNVLQFFNPQVEVEVKKEYIKGETVKDTISVIDTVYFDKIVKIKADSVEIVGDKTYAKTNFNLSNDTISVTGVASGDEFYLSVWGR